MSAHVCGCDPEEHDHHCENWPNCAWGLLRIRESQRDMNTPTLRSSVVGGIDSQVPWYGAVQFVGGDEFSPSPAPPLKGIHDSGQRQQFASGSLRDPSTGKIKWSRITFGPMMRRWAQHLTTAEAKYPDIAPGIPNFTLIEGDEELVRYKESAFRHFMAWFYDETNEDHASAVFFNINGVELLKDKRREKGQ